MLIEPFSNIKETFISVCVLIISATAYCFPFVYEGALGEWDMYAMALGYFDSIMSKTPFESTGLYGLAHSYGYYAWLYLFSDVIKDNPLFIFSLMNYSNALSFILMIVPFFFVVKRYWGINVACIANLVLILIPVWSHLSRYGHPQVPAVLLMFVGLALLGFRSHFASSNKGLSIIFLLDVLVVAAFSVCLMFRLDAILMFPLILACLLLEKHSFSSALYRVIPYSVLPLIIFLIVRTTLLSMPTFGQQVQVLETMLNYHNLTRFVEQFLHGNIIFLGAFSPFLLLLFLVSCGYLFYLRKYLTLFFILPVVLGNYLFWLPNPNNGRHFVYLAPSFAVGIAFLGDPVVRLVRHFVMENKKMATTATVFLFLLTFLITTVNQGRLPILNRFPPYKNPYSQEYALLAGQFGQDLHKLEALEKPIFVVTEAIPVIVKMVIENWVSNHEPFELRVDWKTLEVFYNNGRNKFIFCAFSKEKEFVIALQKKAEEFKDFYWVVDPYNPSIFNKPFNAHAPISAEKLEF